MENNSGKKQTSKCWKTESGHSERFLVGGVQLWLNFLFIQGNPLTTMDMWWGLGCHDFIIHFGCRGSYWTCLLVLQTPWWSFHGNPRQCTVVAWTLGLTPTVLTGTVGYSGWLVTHGVHFYILALCIKHKKDGWPVGKCFKPRTGKLDT